ncbi:MAG: CapA family protein, partial [Myxococcota bacterium]
MNGRWLWAVAVSAGCDPFAAWPEPHEVFPWVYAPETDLADYETVRVETETWTPLVDLPETALYVQKSLYHKPSAPYDERVHFGMSRPAIPPLAAGDVTLSFVGDVMRFDGGWSTFADGVADRLDGAIRAGNLETPISASAPTDPDALADQFGLYAFNAPASLLDGLPLDLVQVNNNHALDVGDLGLEETVAAVSATGRVPIGMDANAAVATVGDLTIGYLSYTWGLNVQEPSAHDLHVVPFGHRDAPIDLGPVATQVAALRADGVGFVVVMVHWGYEFEYYPDPQFLQHGRELVGLGADLVVGSGPHAVEPAEVCEVNRPAAVPRIGRCAVRTD